MIIQIKWVIGNRTSREAADVIKVPEKFLRGDIPYYIFSEPDEYDDSSLGKHVPTWTFVSLNNFPTSLDYNRFAKRMDFSKEMNDEEKNKEMEKYEALLKENKQFITKKKDVNIKSATLYKKSLFQYSQSLRLCEGLISYHDFIKNSKKIKKSRKIASRFYKLTLEIQELKKNLDALENYLFTETYISQYNDNVMFTSARTVLDKESLIIKEEMLEEEGIGDIYSTPEGNQIALNTKWDRDLNEGDSIKKDYVKPLLAFGLGCLITGLLISLVFVVLINSLYVLK